MPRFRVKDLEKFVVRTIYHIEAVDEAYAERLCKSGNIAYDKQFIEEGDEEWLETISVEPC